MGERRVAVTGMGIVSCIGTNVEEFARRLFAGESGIARIERFDPTGLRNEEAGEVKQELSPPEWAPGDWPLDFLFTLVATDEALRDASLPPDLGDVPTGCMLSTNFGCGEAFEEFAADPEGAECFADVPFHAVVEALKELLDLRGPAAAVSISCASGTAAVGLGADLIRLGYAERVLAGGYDMLSLFSQSGLSILRTITAEKIRPFDVRRSGTIFGEGAAILVLESLEEAQRRGATVHAEILGHGLNNNAYHLTAPDKEGEGIAVCIEEAIRDAGIDPRDIDYVNAHGTATEYHDVTEVKAIKALLGEHAYEIPVSSIKAATGHTMGAAGSMEIIATILAMHKNLAPPTLNLDEPDPECDLDHVPWRSKEHEIHVALSNSAGIGGGNASIVLAEPGWVEGRK